MGCYINPPDQTKEQWLRQNAEVLLVPPSSCGELAADKLPVCLVDNGSFTAAGVAFDDRELEAFQDPSDPRPKVWFSAPRTLIREVSPLIDYER